MPPKIAFYPCCSSDIEEPLQILSGLADEVYFCDINLDVDKEVQKYDTINPKIKNVFLHGDARNKIDELGNIDVLFYRRDSEGDGGSGLFVLGDSFLPTLLNKFTPNGGLIITDGSNSRGNNFRKMKRNSGLKKGDWHIYKSEDQKFLSKFGLYVFEVCPIPNQPGLT